MTRIEEENHVITLNHRLALARKAKLELEEEIGRLSEQLRALVCPLQAGQIISFPCGYDKGETFRINKISLTPEGEWYVKGVMLKNNKPQREQYFSQYDWEER